VEWLVDKIEGRCAAISPAYRLSRQLKRKKKESAEEFSLTVIFDLPGQMELYLQSESLKRVIITLVSRLGLKTCLLELFDATYMYEINNFVAMCMVTLTTGINIEMPHISLLSKFDVPLCFTQLLKTMPAHGTLEDYFKVTSLAEMGKDLRLESRP
jgi:hypothetical protein